MIQQRRQRVEDGHRGKMVVGLVADGVMCRLPFGRHFHEFDGGAAGISAVLQQPVISQPTHQPADLVRHSVLGPQQTQPRRGDLASHLDVEPVIHILAEPFLSVRCFALHNGRQLLGVSRVNNPGFRQHRSGQSVDQRHHRRLVHDNGIESLLPKFLVQHHPGQGAANHEALGGCCRCRLRDQVVELAEHPFVADSFSKENLQLCGGQVPLGNPVGKSSQTVLCLGDPFGQRNIPFQDAPAFRELADHGVQASTESQDPPLVRRMGFRENRSHRHIHGGVRRRNDKDRLVVSQPLGDGDTQCRRFACARGAPQQMQRRARHFGDRLGLILIEPRRRNAGAIGEFRYLPADDKPADGPDGRRVFFDERRRAPAE